MPLSRRTILSAASALPFCGPASAKRRSEIIQPQAPFAMPPITVPDFSSSPRFAITDFGASPGDQAKTSQAIASAIAAAHKAGSGVVVVPPGDWPTAAIHLKSNVNLHLEKGATLVFSGNPLDYLPAVATSWEGLECMNYSPLLYAYGCRNIALSGEGKLFANLDVWRIWYARPKPHMDALVALYQMSRKGVPTAKRAMTVGEEHLRPHFIHFNRCRNVLIEGVTIENSPFWTVHPYLCRDVVIRRLNISAHGHNNDGVDPEMSQNVLIEDCVFDQGDDAVSVKSGREKDGWRLATPARNIVMRNCRIKAGHQLMAIGSELAGGIENVFVDNCHFDPPAPSAGPGTGNLLYVKTNERRGGFVRNIHMSNVSASSIAGAVLAVETDVLYQWRTLLPTYERRLTPIEGLHVSAVTVDQAAYICLIKAEAEMPVRDVSLRDVKVRAILKAPVSTDHVEGFRLDA